MTTDEPLGEKPYLWVSHEIEVTPGTAKPNLPMLNPALSVRVIFRGDDALGGNQQRLKKKRTIPMGGNTSLQFGRHTHERDEEAAEAAVHVHADVVVERQLAKLHQRVNHAVRVAWDDGGGRSGAGARLIRVWWWWRRRWWW